MSYLFCLKEIADFKNSYEKENVKRVLNKTYVLVGKKDKVFDLLCDKSYCENSLKYVEVLSAGHGLIDSNPEDVIRLLRKSSISS
ncbi:MAG: hypothetical protein HYV38_00805 [Candidatus Levybacteria bacterium]|nr:hypothetical protein [Candidatus Levybacteria bacterium]